MHHLNHGLQNIIIGLGLPLMPLGLAVAASMVMHHEVIKLPFALWLAMTVTLLAGLIMRGLAFRVAVRCRLHEALKAVLATQSLGYTKMMASFQGELLRVQDSLE